MHRLLLLLFVLAACATNGAEPQHEKPAPDLAGYVNPFVGTGGHGHTFPGATVPFGMVQLSPDTRLTGWDGCSGYHYSDRHIYGFSHTHLSGTGVSDYGDILFAPGVGATMHFRREHYRAGFRKENERAEPGYYEVKLDNGVHVGLTCTARVGLHRYEYPESKVGNLVLDLLHRDKITKTSLKRVSDKEIEGERWSTAWARDQRVFFVARFSRPFRTWAFLRGLTKAYFSFDPATEPLLVKVGISATSIAGARKNLEAELGGDDFGFDRVRAQARAAWNKTLGKIQVEGQQANKRTFYTALYHCCIAPNLFSDVDGTYRGLDGEVHDSRGHDVYTVFSLWDTFRALHPLLLILEPERTVDFLKTFIAHYEDGGRLPVWELAGNETECMIGYHAVPVIADAYLKGLSGYDIEKLYAACRHFAMLDQRGQDAYKQFGFIPAEHEGESVSKTLEYGYDDWCIAMLAEALGKKADKELFLRRSQAWRHLFDPETRFLRPKRNQTFVEPFDPRQVDQNFTEANAWQYTFFVPQDVPGLMKALGGPAAFAKRLDDLFEAPEETTGNKQSDITGLIGQYAHGNEPSHHMAWLYNHAGQPWKTQARVRQILTTLYSDKPDGLCGNEDCGQMSAWYVFAAMGFYPICPGSDRYELAAPLFEKIRIDHGGWEFRIEAPGGSRKPFVQDCRVDSHKLEHSFLTHRQLMNDGTLHFRLVSEPDKTWATRPREPEQPLTTPITPVPFVVAPAQVFRGEMEIELRCTAKGARIHYTLDGRDPLRLPSKVYREPIRLTKTTTLKAFAMLDGRTSSPVIEASFHALAHDWGLKLNPGPSTRYNAGGPMALLDGLHGSKDWRTGSWHGYQTDFEAILDLKKQRPVKRVACRFLQETRSWIWLPTQLEFSVSNDGVNFTKVKEMPGGLDPKDDNAQIKELAVSPSNTSARYVRIRAKNFGKIPEWHLGKGGKAWIFIDEITIE